MTHTPSAKTTIGILGSGQLAKMSAQAAQRLGFKVAILGAHKNDPAATITQNFFQGSIENKDDVLHFCEQVDFITLENEFVPSDILKEVDEKFPGKLFPKYESYQKIENKFDEKKYFKSLGVPVTPFQLINDIERDVDNFIHHHGPKVVVKASKGGYDGYGNKVATGRDEILKAVHEFSQKGDVILEKFLKYEKEIAVIAASNGKQIEIYPAVDTLQNNGICHFVKAPSSIQNTTFNLAKDLTKRVMQDLGRGLYCFEFFVLPGGKLVLNESAPRPHNSGHITIEANSTSQYENHIRCTVGMNLGTPEMTSENAVMVNFLGIKDGDYDYSFMSDIHPHPGVFYHFYGKETSRVGRKMGHCTIVGESEYSTMNKAEEILSHWRKQ